MTWYYLKIDCRQSDTAITHQNILSRKIYFLLFVWNTNALNFYIGLESFFVVLHPKVRSHNVFQQFVMADFQQSINDLFNAYNFQGRSLLAKVRRLAPVIRSMQELGYAFDEIAAFLTDHSIRPMSEGTLQLLLRGCE